MSFLTALYVNMNTSSKNAPEKQEERENNALILNRTIQSFEWGL